MSDQRHTWPNWRRGQTLHAQELRDLEAYLLSRSGLGQTHAHGVSWLHPQRSFEVRTYDAYLAVKATGLAGITPGGHPVHIGQIPDGRAGRSHGTDPVEGMLEVGDSESVKLDVSVQVGDAEEEVPLGDPSRKLQLILSAVERDTPTPQLRDDRLYLGRYSWLASHPELLDLRTRPLPRSFDALEPWDANWEAWTAELHANLAEIRSEADALAASRDSEVSASLRRYLADCATRLYTTWTRLSWAEIDRSWQETNELIQAAGGGTFERRVPHRYRPWMPKGTSGELVPSALVSHNRREREASRFAQWRLWDGTVIEGELEPNYLRCWVVGGRTLPRGRLHVAFRYATPDHVEMGHTDSRFLTEARVSPDDPKVFDVHDIVMHLERGAEAVIRGFGDVAPHDLTFRMD